MAEVFFVKLPSNEDHWTLPMISQHWFRQWVDAIRQEAVTGATVDPSLCHHMASLGHSHWYLVIELH